MPTTFLTTVVTSPEAIDGHVVRGLRREWFLRPAAMAALEAEPRDARHQVQFRRPDVAMSAPEDPRGGTAIRVELDVVRGNVLSDHIEDVSSEVPGLCCKHRT